MPARLALARVALAATSALGPAAAEVAPGPPPWSCQVVAASDARACIPLPGMLASPLVGSGDGPATLRLDGRTVSRHATTAEARAAARAGAIPVDAALILVNDDSALGDSVGFAAYAPSSRGGVMDLSPTFASLVCTGT